MDRGRKRSKRKRVEYIDVVPSTDLPPLVEGELRCFLHVSLGRLTWGNITPSRAPPVSPAYVRLRWWGEASDGTLFRPQGRKDEVTIKSRAQFGIRSGPKQMTAYFNDMGSITLDILSSPKSMPIGRVQVPNVASLSSNSPIRGFFPIISSSSRKLGELHVAMSLKSLRNAYDDDSNDTGTDSSFSSRSRNTSARGVGSRRSSRSRQSSVGSARSRSSSAGSYKPARGRSRSNGRKQGRRKHSSSDSHDRNKRSNSRDSAKSHHSCGGYSDHHSNPDVPTPRGIDSYLEENGHDLYSMGLPSKKESKQKKPVDSSGIDMNAIQALLQRGKKLRDEITQSALSSDAVPPSPHKPERHLVFENVGKSPKLQPLPNPSPARIDASPRLQVQIPDQPESKLTQPISMPTPKPVPLFHHNKTNTEMRLVDMVLQAKGINDDLSNLAEVSSLHSGMGSIVSDIEDPLHDESILQHLFYNNMGFYPSNRPELERTLISEPTYTEAQLLHLRPQAPLSVQPQSTQATQKSNPVITLLDKLSEIHLARVTVKGIQLNETPDSDDEKPANKRGTKKRDLYVKVNSNKPPSSSAVKKQSGTYFVEYKFPFPQRPHGATSTSHEVTRIASRRLTPGGLVKFDQHSIFPVHFTKESLSKWMTESLQFIIHYKSPKGKKLRPVGKATMSLRQVIDAEDFLLSDTVEIIRDNPVAVCGCIKVSVELTQDSKDLPSEMSPAKRPVPVKVPNTYAISKPARDEFTVNKQQQSQRRTTHQHFDESRVAAVIDPLLLGNDDHHPLPLNLNHNILYLYVMIQEARDIPATKPPGTSSSTKCNFPSVYLICRTFASDEACKTPVVWNTSNPKFNFFQELPVKIDGELFSRLKNNYMVVEVWTKVRSSDQLSDKLMGLVKIPLHIFYQSLKDEEIARAVLESKYPMVSVDTFLPVVDVFTNTERGKLLTLLALGTKEQIGNLKKMKEVDEIPQQSHKPSRTQTNESLSPPVPVLHEFEVTIHGMQDFKPLESQAWGETDCYIQYHFPTTRNQTDKNEDGNDESQTTDAANLEAYRTDTSLCIPNLMFNFTKKHPVQPPHGVPVHRLILGACSGVGKHPGGGIPFEMWSRYYYPNVRDQLLAKGCLPAAKLCSMITMKHRTKCEETFNVPMKFVNADENQPTSAGDLRITIQYKSGSQSQLNEPPKELCRNVKLQVAVLRACGLKRAAELAASVTQDESLTHSATVGVNSYVVMRLSFLHDEKPRQTRCIARHFSPDFNHHFDVMCPIASYHNDVEPISLAEQLSGGEVDFEIWHKPTPEDSSAPSSGDVLLGRVTIPTSDLLTKTTGFSGWYPVTSIESLQRKSIVTVGGLEISLTFPCQQDLELILRAARSLAWKPSSASDLSRLLLPDCNGLLKAIDEVVTKEDYVTVSMTVTNAWLPKSSLTRGGNEIERSAHVYIRYKFFDKDSTTSSVCPVIGGSRSDRDPQTVKIAHRCSFPCRSNHPLVWYLREELLQIQVWLTHSRSARAEKRPLDSDKLLGVASIDMSSMLVGGLHRQQHISGLYSLYKPGIDDMGEACLRVYASINPGYHKDDTTEDESSVLPSTSLTSSDEDDGVEVLSHVNKVPSHHEVGTAFKAVVHVERAMHLPPPSPHFGTNPGCYVSYAVDGSDTESTTIVSKVTDHSSSPVWEDTQDVNLDRKLLQPGGGDLIFRVWIRADQTDSDQKPLSANDRMMGFASVDLSTLSAGFNAVNGWYNIIDLHGNCQGQLKVAVTPSDPICKPANSPPRRIGPVKGLLHSVPLITPVQTPSGSMYIPCVSLSQTVGTTCRVITTTSSQHQPAFEPRTTTAVPIFGMSTTASVPRSIGNYASRSIFRQDQQQSCLLQTLQRQMKELDEIKQNFQQRNKAALDALKPVSQTVEYTSTVTFPTLSSTETFIVPKTVVLPQTKPPHADLSATKTLNLNSSVSDEEQRMLHMMNDQHKANRKQTVHMSLFKTDKDAFEEEAALSDTEMSDVEFVCPRNLNEQSLFTTEQAEEQKVLGDTLQTTDSELNNTSLWLSASASHVDETVAAEDDQEEEDDASFNSNQDHLSRNLFPEENHHDLEDLNKDDEEPLVEDKRENPVSEEHDRDVASGEEGSGGKDEDHMEDREEKTDVVESNKPNHQDPKDDDDDDQENDEDDCETLVGSDSEEEEDFDEDQNPEQEIVHPDEKHQESEEDQEESGAPLTPKSPEKMEEVSYPSPHMTEDENLRSISDGEGSSDEVSSSEDSDTEENVKSFQRAKRSVLDDISNDSSVPHSSSHHPTLPSFFPPRKDLIASMRSLQAITTEQKHKLIKQDAVGTSTLEDPGTSPKNTRTRRKFVKPSASTDEQTNRLAKIFSTKYTSR
uniref:C2 domain-containing protein 3 n=1 Tax=Phallusia mammillata TaxID=59560 RepID=A0A6F9D8N3_9ASCI|nr:C2 domain-containing protein 3 [Phallusia mammillata]